MNKYISYKSFFTNYGIFIAILTVLFGILIYPIKLSQTAWQNNLKKSVETTLEEQFPNTWTVENNIKIKNTFQLNSACYEARNRKDGNVYKVLILRVQSYYGPLPAVFLIDKNNAVEFIGFTSLHGRILQQINTNTTNSRINYWKNKIPEIIE